MLVTRFGLARRIVERFRPRRGAPRRVAEVLLRRQRRLSMRRLFNVGVTVHLHRHTGSTLMHTVGRVVRTTAAPPTVLRSQTLPAALPVAVRTIEHVMFQRILARGVRRETLTRDRRSTVTRELAPSPSSATPRVPDAARPVEFVLRRAAPAVVDTDQRGRSVADALPRSFARTPITDGASRSAAAAPTIPLSPSELARLTDDVVRAIDRRFVAHRERRGVV